MQPDQRRQVRNVSFDRSDFLRAGLFVVGFVFIFRLFYLQIIKHEYYSGKAVSEHTAIFEVQAPRGGIEINDGENTVPIVLNETRYTVYADPQLVKKKDETALKLAEILSVDSTDLRRKLDENTRYSVVAKQVTRDKQQKIAGQKLLGIGTKPQNYRTYPQGSLAAQLLGFVNDDGNGQYGVEEALNSELKGQSGTLKAITDNDTKNPVPLATANDNILLQPKNGQTAVLGIDLSLQKLAEDALKERIDEVKAKSGSVVIMDPNTGLIKAMANYPSYDPSKYQDVTDLSLFSNPIVSSQYEVGSIVKSLTTATALDKGVISLGGNYYDPGFWNIDGAIIRNALEYGSGTKPISDVLNHSLNTGVVYFLKQLGGGEINDKARLALYDYFKNHFMLGQVTGVEQSGEVSGAIGSPTEGDGLDIRYANMTFGQGMSITMMQMISAFSAAINGGNYYQPHIVEGWKDVDGNIKQVEPRIIKTGIVSESTSKQLRLMLEDVAKTNIPNALRSGYSIGSKSGTAQIPDGNGSYRTDAYIGTYIGFVGGAKPEYAILVRLDEPGVPGFAGRVSAPLFTKISNGILDRFAITPKQ